jgi:hypothetical protein
MAICPDHGGYQGDTCKKCQPNAPAIERNLDITKPLSNQGQAPGPEVVGAVSSGPPKLDEHDKLTLVKLENDSLKSFHRMQTAQAQLQNFAQTMFEKYKVKPAEYTLDMERLEFVLRGM